MEHDPMLPVHRFTCSRRARGGFSLVEVSVALCVVVIALSGLVGSLLASARLHRVSAETATAQRAAVLTLEALQGAPFEEIFAAYNRSSADDGGLSSAAPGPNFAVAGLNTQVGDADGMCGVIEFPAALVGAQDCLFENVVDAGLGSPRDLNLDGAVDAANHAADYQLLPVRIAVRWRGVTGDREVVLETILCSR